MGKNYKPITSMKEVPEQLRKLRRQYLRYQQAESISARTLADMDRAVSNFKKGDVSQAIDLSDL